MGDALGVTQPEALTVLDEVAVGVIGGQVRG